MAATVAAAAAACAPATPPSTPNRNRRASALLAPLKPSLAAPVNGEWRPGSSLGDIAKDIPGSGPEANGTMASILAQIEMDYFHVKKTDVILHQHLGNWLEHMEQWMHCQQKMFKQLQNQCNFLGLQEPNTTVNCDFEPLLEPQEHEVHANAKPPRLPIAVRMTAPNGAEQIQESDVFGEVAHEQITKEEADVPTPGEWDPIDAGKTSGGRAAPSKAVRNDTYAEPVMVNVALLEDEPILSEGVTFTLNDPATQVGLQVITDDMDENAMGAMGSIQTEFRSSVTIGSTNSTELVPINHYGSSDVKVSGVQFEDNASTTFEDFVATTSGRPNLPQEYRMWIEIVDKIIQTAKKKKFYELRQEWIREDTWVSKVMRNHPGLDLRVLVAERGDRGRLSASSRSDSGRGDGRSSGKSGRSTIRQSMRTTRRSVKSHFVINSASSESTSLHYHNAMKRKTSMSSNEDGGHKPKHASERFVLDPQSPSRLVWMMIGMLLMLYDLMVLPLNQAFELPDHMFLEFMQWFSQVFWTLDIGVTFMTGVYVNSELVTKLRTIARVYTTTWLPFDVAVVAPLWVVQVAAVGDSSTKGASNAGFFRFVRMVRFLRLARLAKFEHYLQEALATINSSSLILCVGIFKLMVMMVTFNHLNACCWYAVGAAGNGGWVEFYDGTSLFYKYLTSMHWAFTQFQGTSEILPGIGEGKLTGERAYAVICVMFALIILSFFVSSLTNMMMQLQALRNERVGMARAVREYLNDNAISKGLSIRVKKYIDWKQRMQRKMDGSDKVLRELPVALQIDLEEEVRGPIVYNHKFFVSMKYRHSRAFRILVHDALQPLSPTPGEMVFSKQDEANRMYFVVSGLSRYMPTKSIPDEKRSRDFHEEVRRTLINPTARDNDNNNNNKEEEDTLKSTIRDIEMGAYLCEPVLWTFWEHRGVFMGVSDSHYLTIVAKDFSKSLMANHASHVSAILYARQFIAGLNRFGKTYNDIIDIAELTEDEFD